MSNTEKVLKLIEEGHHSTPALYLSLVKQTPEEFAQMRKELEGYDVTFEIRQTDGQYDLYLIDGRHDAMIIVATNSQPEWLEERGFSLV
ncbi:hypothetical protein D3C81_193560 [compost metagenome]|jgi:hypothetical protein